MENKKPLIIVPPLSAPMQKLKEVLEGIAAEENIEIFTVEDAKEFGQLIGSGGQSLVMLSNAKLAANLLQENKALISRNHTKVILLTPKEIPQKTLLKFTKIGLTEAILESSPPKTLLYKVKLLLRSIKITQKEENAPKVVKSMLDMNTALNSNEEIAQDAQHVGTIDHNSTDEVDKNKKIQTDSEENTLDYLSNLKGKRTSTDESIETHWKGKKDRSTNQLDEEEEENLKTKSDIRDEEIDKYYRGKQKKNEIELEIEPAFNPKIKINEDEEESNRDSLSKLNTEEELIEEDIGRRKKIIYDDEDEKDFIQKAEEKEIELNLEKEKKSILEEEQSELDEINDELLTEIEADEKKRKAFQEEDLGGHLKGKIKKEAEEETPEITQENSKLEEVEEARSKDKKNRTEEEIESEITQKNKTRNEEDEDHSHDGEVDVIDNFMRGDLNSPDEIKTRMEFESDKDKKKKNEEENEEELDNHKRAKLEEIEEETGSKKLNLDLLEGEETSKNDNLDEESDEASEFARRNKLLNEDEEDPYGKVEITKEEKNDDSLQSNSKRSKLEEAEEENRKRLSLEEDEKDINKKKTNTNLELEPGKNGLTRDGKTDKISTFYRSGENNKKDQDWDINNKKNGTAIELEHGKNEINSLGDFKKHKDSGEITIDYKKLKAEFDLISRGEDTNGIDGISGHGSSKSGLEIEDDSFQVIELGTISLDFAVESISLYMSQEIKPISIFKSVAEKILKEEKAYIFAKYYKDSKYTEAFSSYNEFRNQIPENINSEWELINKEELNNDLFHSFSMPTWLCREIPDQGSFWRDIELPTWANKELTNKKVELLFPFFDGVDRVGYVHIYFPQGINPQAERKILLIIEMLRGVYLENAPRKRANLPIKEDVVESENTENKGKILNFFGNMFGKKKAS